ncbi:thioredoxin family protein [Flagellimonas taeanensis]|uniref:Thioredoxin-related protein n=1 Tax=Flagellimonas taeanensis TaxID=1005926 RepID=A0A1M6UMQ4_9FLAO|nr:MULTISPECIES: thioredoxin family protein [Allomuricauda]MDC6385868.1 thioredoxin family protein [Muricauda sp. SK9]MEE1964254.1 thioredoxin family protein [Allomuricauda taeanensis]RIV50843.1 thioredoxin family protein [Allomuricauda taeanensis]SFC54734.1 Thioredoxin-related protein [Allomuricauda taeanensis]SHK70461.1 Thioredoxin-related protein [Allomuricauda taeanensis]
MKRFLTFIFFVSLGALHAQEWQDSYASALDRANTADKPIVLVFSGSDWCAPCIRLKKSILDTEEFKTYASKNYVLYNADFPRKKQNQLPEEKSGVNKMLAEKYNPKGYFPLVVVLDKNGSVLGETGFNPRLTPEKYISLLNKFIK